MAGWRFVAARAVLGLADRVAIMRQGEIVETGETGAVFRALAHPYTRALFEASGHVPQRVAPPALEPGAAPVLAVDDVVRDYRLPRKNLFRPPATFRAVDNVSLTINRGENVGLVGESGRIPGYGRMLAEQDAPKPN